MPSKTPQYSSASLYVGDLDPEVNETTLFHVFSQIGPVASIRVCREAGTRRSLGYAYINYHNAVDAERSMEMLNYSLIKGVPCRIMWSNRDPSVRKTGNGNIFIKNLDKIVDNKALFDTFSLFGEILSCKVQTDEEGKSKGFGYVHYSSEDAAKLAIEKLNGMQIGNKVVYVGPFKKKAERIDTQELPFTNLYVKQFPDEWQEELLTRIFSEFGKITSAVISTDSNVSSKRRFAFVNYESFESAKMAIQKLHGRKVNSEGVLWDEHLEKTERDFPEASEKAGSTIVNEVKAAAETENEGKPLCEKEQKGENLLEEAKPKNNDDEVPGLQTAQNPLSELTCDKPPSCSLSEADTLSEKTVLETEDTEQGLNEKEANEDQVNQSKRVDGSPEKPLDPSKKSPRGLLSSTASSSTKTAIMKELDAVPEGCLYVQRAMTKSERIAKLRENFSCLSTSKQKQSGSNLYVKNLEESVREEDLRELFSKFGTVTSVRIMRDQAGISKGFGFVCFALPEQATKAVTSMNSEMFHGKPLYVGLAEKKDQRTTRLLQRYKFSSYRPNPAVVPPPMLPYGNLGSHQHMFVRPHGQPGIPLNYNSRPALQYAGEYGMANHPENFTNSGINSSLAWNRGNLRSPAFGPAALSQMQGTPTASVVPPYPYHMNPNALLGSGGMMPPLHRGSYANMPQPPLTNMAPPQKLRNGMLPGNASHVSQAANFKMPGHLRERQEQTQFQDQHPQIPVAYPSPLVMQDPLLNDAAGYLPSSNRKLLYETLNLAHPQKQKQILGERLFPLIHKHEPVLAGKITGMMLEMDNGQLLDLLDSESLLQAKIREALGVLHRHQNIPADTSLSVRQAS